MNALGPGEPHERPARDDGSVSNGEIRERERERNGESLPTLDPRVPPEHGHTRQRPVAVEGDRNAQRAGLGGPRVGKLERDEREEGDGSRVAPVTPG